MLGAAVFLFVAFLFFMGFYVYAVLDKPRSSAGKLLITEGRFLTIAAGSQRGIAFIVKESGSERLIKFNAIPGYTSVQSGFSAGAGKAIVVQHYDRLVVSCKIEGVEYCISNCASEYECGMNLYRANVSALEKMVCTLFVFVVLCLVAFFVKRKQER
jgi:hypothetical protein